MRFYVWFASACGTLVLITQMLILFRLRIVNLNVFGTYGLIAMALIYAIIRYAIAENPVLFARADQESSPLHRGDSTTA